MRAVALALAFVLAALPCASGQKKGADKKDEGKPALYTDEEARKLIKTAEGVCRPA